ncbi:class I SAM-dependent methyltransferase [Actinoplanes sp. NPDC048988]|uniref:class I SAM-dependent methyltransferase n=1 Tax=Actinoplanes sp. NPDC048988 TaxID=3363901 RepID=UPI003712AB77
MTTDWLAWHDEYDDPDSSLSRRLTVVRDYLTRALSEAPAEADGRRRLISLCAGDGRDVLPILARHDRGRAVHAVLTELDPELAARARATATRLGLPGVDVRTGDSGSAGTFLDAAPAHIVMACGVFGNISDGDVRRTIAALPALLAEDGIVIWTRGRGGQDADPSESVRADLEAHGFQEIAFTRPVDARFRVGLHRLATAPPPGRLTAQAQLFSFVPRQRE